VVETSSLTFQEGVQSTSEPRILFVGDDSEGVPLEVIGVEFG
jgi:hypothetical protein